MAPYAFVLGTGWSSQNGVNMPGRGWPDGFYELAPEILICDLNLHFECKMDCTFFAFVFFVR